MNPLMLTKASLISAAMWAAIIGLSSCTADVVKTHVLPPYYGHRLVNVEETPSGYLRDMEAR